MKEIMLEWRRFLKESKEFSVLAHLVGQAGSGKTWFIENTLLKKYPEIVAKDLDDFDDEADAHVASGEGDKSWRQDADNTDQELARKHFDIVQNLIDQFLLSNNDKNIFLVGMSIFPWVEGKNQLDLGNPLHKFYLDKPAEKSAEQRIIRDIEKGLYDDKLDSKTGKLPEKDYKDNISADIKHAKKEKDQLLGLGYKLATPEEIIKTIGITLREE